MPRRDAHGVIMHSQFLTTCGHDINVRCLRCAADFDPVQPRRWAVACKRSKALAERKITADEARTAIIAVLVSSGMRLDLIREYDAARDEFVLLVRKANGTQTDCWIPAETVADTVLVARVMSGMFDRMWRPSDRAECAGK